MRLLYVFLAILATHTATAQDLCKDITRQGEGSTVREFESPYNESEPPMVRVKRTISNDEYEPFDNFVLIFRVKCSLDDIYDMSDNGGRNEKQEKNLTVFFDDNTSIVNDTIDVTHDLTPDHTEAIRFVYYPLVPEIASDFASKKINHFKVAGQDVKMTEEDSKKLMNYINCIYKEK